jgi:hypothetical protein
VALFKTAILSAQKAARTGVSTRLNFSGFMSKNSRQKKAAAHPGCGFFSAIR